MEKMRLYLNQIAEVFGYKYDELFFSYLKSISKPNFRLCGKEIKRGEGGFRCIDCSLLSNTVICNNCFNKTKDKHKGHNVIFIPYSNGFCDCGDPDCVIKESFCQDHQGPFTNEKEISDYIKTCIDEKSLNIIEPFLNNIFIEIIEKIKEFITNENKEEMHNIEDELYDMIDNLISFVSNLYNNNLGLFFFVTLKFTENYPFETNHKCFKYDEEHKKIIIIKENLMEKHICICPFFQIIINILLKKKTEHDSKEFINLFIQNYKNNIITSLSFIHTFAEFYENSNLETVRELGYQLLNSSLCEIMYSDINFPILENFFLEIYEKTKKLIELKKYNLLYELINHTNQILIFLPYSKYLDIIISKIKIHSIIIDIFCLINNLNIFENKIKFDIFQREGYICELIDCEIDCIETFNLLFYLVDFNNLDSVKFISNKILTKIFEFKKYKENLTDKIYSPHMIIFQCYSIFLNRFCFNYSLNNNCDLLDALQYFQNLITESKQLNVFIFKELINFFGFIISTKYSFFNYFGEDMELYYKNYFKYNLDIFLSFISLMKYLLTLPEIQIEFNINNFNNILAYSNISNCNDLLLNLKLEDFNEKNEILKDEIERNLKYFNSILELILIIIRDNLSMIKIAFMNADRFKMNYKDILFQKLLNKEKINFEDLIKNQIIHYIIGNKNIIKRENCLKLYNNFYKDLHMNLIDNLLKENCEEIISTNQLKQYSLKKEIFSYFDIDYIFDCNERINAIKYVNEFQSKNCNILNTYILNSLSIQKDLNLKINDVFFNNKNIDNFINFYKILLSNIYPSLTDIFFFTYSKILCVFIKLYNFDMNKDFKNNLISIINNNKLEGKYNDSIQYIKKILLNEKILENNNKIEDRKKKLKEKYKKKFDTQNNNIAKKYSLENIENENNNFSETEKLCIYCRQSFNNDLNNYFGKICYLISDYFIDILKKKDENIRTKSTRFITCNHKIHFECYNKFVIETNYDNNLLKEGFACPLCKKLSNIILCDLSNIKNYDILKGLNLEIENNYYDKNDYGKYKNLFLQNEYFFEIYTSKLLKRDILIKDIIEDKNIFKEIYNKILNDFDAFYFYYNLTSYKNEQINIWKNILLSLRLLCKYRINKGFDFFISKFKSIYECFQKLNLSYLYNFDISSIINEFIFCLYILYDLDEKNKEKIKNLFQNNILIYILLYSFLEKKENNFEQFLLKKENHELIEKIFKLYSSKYKICFLLYDEKEENLQLNLDIHQIKNNPIIKNVLDNYKNLITKTQYLEIPEFNIINLPENYIEFGPKYMNINCIYCNKKHLDYYVCLICGKKMCSHINCVIKLGEKKLYSLVCHSKKCAGGNSIFISSKNTEIIYFYKRRFYISGIFVYLNSFGESPEGYNLNGNYLLNKKELENSIKKYIELTYRKKSFQIGNPD